MEAFPLVLREIELNMDGDWAASRLPRLVWTSIHYQTAEVTIRPSRVQDCLGALIYILKNHRWTLFILCFAYWVVSHDIVCWLLQRLECNIGKVGEAAIPQSLPFWATPCQNPASWPNPKDDYKPLFLTIYRSLRILTILGSCTVKKPVFQWYTPENSRASYKTSYRLMTGGWWRITVIQQTGA